MLGIFIFMKNVERTFLKSFVKHGFILCPPVSGFLRISSKAVQPLRLTDFNKRLYGQTLILEHHVHRDGVWWPVEISGGQRGEPWRVSLAHQLMAMFDFHDFFGYFFSKKK